MNSFVFAIRNYRSSIQS